MSEADEEVLRHVLSEWEKTQQLEQEYRCMQERLAAAKTDRESIVPVFRKWNGERFVLEKPQIKTHVVEYVMCAGTAAVLTAKILGVLPESVTIDTNHVFQSRTYATVHIKEAQANKQRCALYDLIEWKDLKQKLLNIAEDKTGMMRRLEQEYQQLLTASSKT
jgi:hypothetical protein